MRHHVHIAYFFPVYILFNLLIFMIVKGVRAYREYRRIGHGFIECYITELRTIRVRDLLIISILPP